VLPLHAVGPWRPVEQPDSTPHAFYSVDLATRVEVRIPVNVTADSGAT